MAAKAAGREVVEAAGSEAGLSRVILLLDGARWCRIVESEMSLHMRRRSKQYRRRCTNRTLACDVLDNTNAVVQPAGRSRSLRISTGVLLELPAPVTGRCERASSLYSYALGFARIALFP